MTIDLLVVVLFALAVAGADVLVGLQRTANTNGYGCVDDVLLKQAENPMQNRILIPLLLSPFHDEMRVGLYAMIKSAGIVAAGCAMYALTGMVGAMMMLAAIGGSILFDYADHGWEIAAVAASYLMVRDPSLLLWAIPLCVAWALMRESAVFGPIILLCGGWFIWGALALSAVLIVRWGVRQVWGNPPNYVVRMAGSLFPIRMNLKEAREMWQELGPAMIFTPLGGSVCLLSFQVIVVFGLMADGFTASELSLIVPALVMTGASLLWGKWNETRIFLPALCPMIAGFTLLR